MALLRLLAYLGLDKTAFDAGLTKASKEVDKFGTGLKRQLAGAFAAASVVAFTKSIIEMGGSIKDTSDRLGITVEDVQALSLAARLGGSDLSTFATAIERMRKSGAEGKGLEAFGISRQMMLDQDPVTIFRELGTNIEQLGLNAARTKALFDVFGRGVGQLVAAFMELRNVTNETFLSQGQAETLDKLGDKWTILTTRAKIFAANLLMHPEAPLQGVSYRGKPRTRVSESEEIAIAEQKAREDHIAQQDEIIRLEKDARQKLSEQHMREQDEILRREKLSKLTPFELELRKNTEAMQNIERALTERGIVVRDIVQ